VKEMKEKLPDGELITDPAKTVTASGHSIEISAAGVKVDGKFLRLKVGSTVLPFDRLTKNGDNVSIVVKSRMAASRVPLTFLSISSLPTSSRLPEAEHPRSRRMESPWLSRLMPLRRRRSPRLPLPLPQHLQPLQLRLLLQQQRLQVSPRLLRPRQSSLPLVLPEVRQWWISQSHPKLPLIR